MSASNAMADYAEYYAAFDAGVARHAVMGEPGAAINGAWLCCDRHCVSGATALNWESNNGAARDLSFEDLRDESQRFAAVLRNLGVGKGDRIACLLPRIPELVVALLAAWRLGAVYQPLFTAFGPKAIEHRVSVSRAKVIVTDATNRPKLDEVESTARIVTVVAPGGAAAASDVDYRNAVAAARPHTDLADLTPDDPALIMFTSGTTGPAKPLLVPLKAMTAAVGYMREAVGLREDDTFWNIADPGWGYGLYYAVVGPLAMGHATLLYDGPFSTASTVDLIARRGITNLAGAPTAFRQMIAAGPEAVRAIKGQLRAVSSAGEPLNPEVIRWFAEHLDATIHDHYGQTELGMVLCNHHALSHPVTAGAAGLSMPGHRMAVLDDAGQELPPGQPGMLALDRTASPLFWFTGYEGMATPSLGDRYYLTGDTAELNRDGSISFVGRSDDVITSSGYRIGPFDVESALIEHPAVIEAAVIGKPDPERTEIVKAFVILHQGFAPDDGLAEDLRKHVRARLSAHAYPREIAFVESLPKTPSGKIQRFILRNQELAEMAAAQQSRESQA